MPRRNLPLVTNEIYHVFNRGNGNISIFRSHRHYLRFLEVLFYYQWGSVSLPFSKFFTLNEKAKSYLEEKLRKREETLVEIIAFCLMPTHFHLLVRQAVDDGILKLMRFIQNSYSHYFNKKNGRMGGLFVSTFKAIRVESEPQLLHLSRYIHLNPYSSCLVKDSSELLKYPYSSLPEYLGLSENNVCHKEIVLSQFPKTKDYREFVLDRADYQRSLESLKHHVFEFE